MTEVDIEILGQNVSWYSLKVSLRLGGSKTAIPTPIEAYMDPRTWAQFYNEVNSRVLTPLGKKISLLQWLKLASYLVGLLALVLIISSLASQAAAEESFTWDDSGNGSAVRYALYPLLFLVPVIVRGYVKRASKNFVAHAMSRLEAACKRLSRARPALLVSVVEDAGEVRCGGLELSHVKISVAAPKAVKAPIAPVAAEAMLAPSAPVVDVQAAQHAEGQAEATCPGCGAASAEGARLCLKCGRALGT